MKYFALMCFVTLTSYCFSQKNRPIEMINFTNNEFKIEYPESWTLDTSGQWGAEVVIFSPMEGEADKFNENVNVLIQNLEGQNIDLEKYKQITEQQITELAIDGKIIESDIVKTVKGESFQFTYSMTQGMFKLMITAVCFIQNESAYLVTFTSEIEQYGQYKNIAGQILGSFALIK